MKSRDDYKKALPIIGTVIRAWDPYSLLESGAPNDEFDFEIARIATHIPTIRSASDATQAISIVFSEAFEPENFTPDKCAQPGVELFTLLQKAGIVPPA